MDVYDYVLRW